MVAWMANVVSVRPFLRWVSEATTGLGSRRRTRLPSERGGDSVASLHGAKRH